MVFLELRSKPRGDRELWSVVSLAAGYDFRETFWGVRAYLLVRTRGQGRECARDGNLLERHAICVADAGEESSVHGDCSVGAGPGDWREHGDFQRLQRNAVAPAAGEEPPATGGAGEKDAWIGVFTEPFLSGFSRLPRTEEGLR